MHLLYKIERKYGYIGQSIYLNNLKILPKDHWCNVREKENFPSERLILFSIKVQTRNLKELRDFLTNFGMRASDAFDSLIKAFSSIDLKKLGNAGVRGSEAGKGLRTAMEKVKGNTLCGPRSKHPKI